MCVVTQGNRDEWIHNGCMNECMAESNLCV